MTVDLAALIAQATAHQMTLTAAESCTGGLIAAALTEIPGSSAVFDRGFVTYSNQAKIDMLGVRHDTLDQFGAVSEPVAQQMAEGALNRAQASFAIAVTGIAGPGGSAFKPEGRVCFGLARRNGTTWVETVDFGALGRSRVRSATRDHGLTLLQRAMNDPT